MKKHSHWRKMRRFHRRVLKVACAIEKRDRDRADAWNAAVQKAIADSPNEEYFCIYMVRPEDEYVDFKDIFIEQSPDMNTFTQKPGIHVVERIAHSSSFDYLLETRVLGDEANRPEFLWFPRLGQKVITAIEAGDSVL